MVQWTTVSFCVDTGMTISVKKKFDVNHYKLMNAKLTEKKRIK